MSVQDDLDQMREYYPSEQEIIDEFRKMSVIMNEPEPSDEEITAMLVSMGYQSEPEQMQKHYPSEQEVIEDFRKMHVIMNESEPSDEEISTMLDSMGYQIKGD